MIVPGFKPLLASPMDPRFTRYPMLVSPKLDGIRCVAHRGLVVSRNLKPIPNDHVRSQLIASLPSGPPLDGELMTYTDGELDDFNTCQSKLMSRQGAPEFKLFAFDVVTEGPFHERLAMAADLCHDAHLLAHVPHVQVDNEVELLEAETEYVSSGYEGLMARDPAGRYKFGRSTAREGVLLKLKRFMDEEVLVVGYTERLSNQNEQTRDELGRAKRSSHAAGKVATGSLGSLVCMRGEVTFEVGTGFDEATRVSLWEKPDSLLGKMAKVKYQELLPSGAPRFPVFLCFREDE